MITVDRENPTLRITVENVDLSQYTAIDETALYIRRVGESTEFAKYLPANESGNRFLFILDDLVLDYKNGVFSGRLVYKGVEISTFRFAKYVEPVELRVVH